MEERLKKQSKEIDEIRKMLIEHLGGVDKRALELKVHIKKTINLALAEVVNGKIDAVHQMLEHQNERSDAFEKKVDVHLIIHEEQMAEIKPFLQGVAGFKVLQKLAIWVSAFFLMWVAFKNSIKF